MRVSRNVIFFQTIPSFSQSSQSSIHIDSSTLLSSFPNTLHAYSDESTRVPSTISQLSPTQDSGMILFLNFTTTTASANPPLLSTFSPLSIFSHILLTIFHFFPCLLLCLFLGLIIKLQRMQNGVTGKT